MATPAEQAKLDERRRRRLWQLGATVVVSAAVVIIAIAISRAGGDDPGTTTGPPEGVAETRALLGTVPEERGELGDPKAPFTLTEFADLQCPFCGRYAREVLPEVVRRFVKAGRVKLVFRPLTFIGEDSVRAARMAIAAGLQGRLWQFVDLVYRNQGDENDGWVTDDYLGRIGRAIGLDVPRALRDRGTPPVDAFLETAKGAAEDAGIEGTPSFTIGRGADPQTRLDADPTDRDGFVGVLESALAGG